VQACVWDACVCVLFASERKQAGHKSLLTANENPDPAGNNVGNCHRLHLVLLLCVGMVVSLCRQSVCGCGRDESISHVRQLTRMSAPGQRKKARWLLDVNKTKSTCGACVALRGCMRG